MTPTERYLIAEAAFKRLTDPELNHKYPTPHDMQDDVKILSDAGWITPIDQDRCYINGPPPSQRLWRTLLRVVRFHQPRWIVRAIIPAFNPRLTVSIPAYLIHFRILQELKPGDRLHAHVNIGAESWRDLVFVDFETD